MEFIKPDGSLFPPAKAKSGWGFPIALGLAAGGFRAYEAHKSNKGIARYLEERQLFWTMAVERCKAMTQFYVNHGMSIEQATEQATYETNNAPEVKERLVFYRLGELTVDPQWKAAMAAWRARQAPAALTNAPNVAAIRDLLDEDEPISS